MACSSLLLLLTYTMQDHLPRGALPRMGWPLLRIINQSSSPHACLEANLRGTFFLPGASLFPDGTIACIKLRKSKQHTNGWTLFQVQSRALPMPFPGTEFGPHITFSHHDVFVSYHLPVLFLYFYSLFLFKHICLWRYMPRVCRVCRWLQRPGDSTGFHTRAMLTFDC